MQNIIDDNLIQMLMEQYDLDKETAEHVANVGVNQAVSVIKNASKYVQPCSSFLQGNSDNIKPLISFRHLQQSFGKIAHQFTVKNRLPSILRAAADGNCAMTTMALAIELETSLELAIKCAEENRQPTEAEGVPHLSGEHGSSCWHEGFDIRSCILRFYNSERLHKVLPDSFGEVPYEEKNEKGETCFKYRKMTRCDILCSEVQFGSQAYKEIDMSLQPEAVQKREKIAKDYLATISKSGQWCSTPSLIAFAFLRVPPRPIRVYSLDTTKQTISKYTDIVPEGCLPCCPTAEDEFFLDIINAKDDSKGSIDKHLDDDNEWSSESEDDETTEETTEDNMNEEQEVQEKMENITIENDVSNVSNIENTSSSTSSQYTYNFTRILFYSSHYDLLVTAAERQRILAVWPQVESSFASFDASFSPIFN